MMKSFFEEKLRYDAVFQLLKKDYPELDRARVVITDDVDFVCIGVVASYLVKQKNENGSFVAREEQVGEYCRVRKTAPVSEFFESLREMLEVVSKAVKAAKEANRDVKA